MCVFIFLLIFFYLQLRAMCLWAWNQAQLQMLKSQLAQPMTRALLGHNMQGEFRKQSKLDKELPRERK